MRNDLLCVNYFSRLHGKTVSVDGKQHQIVFCKTDWLHEQLIHLSKMSGSYILVTGNSDYSIGHAFHPVGTKLPDLIPNNVIKMYSQNSLVEKNHHNYDKCEILPIGIENYHPCFRPNNGTIPTNAIEKYEILKRIDTSITPNRFVYSNFTVRTDDCQSTPHRKIVRSISQDTSHIDWEEAKLSTVDYYNKVLRYEAVVCAQGNGPGDNHRIYETLYLGRIPITFNRELYQRLHKNYPLICLESADILKDKDYLEREISLAKSKEWNKEMLYSEYWISLISKLGSTK